MTSWRCSELPLVLNPRRWRNDMPRASLILKLKKDVWWGVENWLKNAEVRDCHTCDQSEKLATKVVVKSIEESTWDEFTWLCVTKENQIIMFLPWTSQPKARPWRIYELPFGKGNESPFWSIENTSSDMVHTPRLPWWRFQIVFTFTIVHPYLRKIPMFDDYFQIGWNRHLALHLFSLRFNAAPTKSHAKCLHTYRQDSMMAGVAARREPFFIHIGLKAGNAIFVGQQLIWRRTFWHSCLHIYKYIYI